MLFAMKMMRSLMVLVVGLILASLSHGYAAEAETAKPADAATTPTAAGADSIAAYVGKKFTQGPASIKKIALTFDDGPSGKLTPQFIEVLKKENVPATFFMLGESVQKSPAMAKRVAEEGFEIGCHTTTHRKLTGLGLDEIRKEIIGTADHIEQVTGKRPHVFRPPYGSTNAAVLKVCAEGNMALVLWSVDTNDWKAGSTTQSVEATIMKEAHGGAVILMHDVHEKSVKILADAIHELKAKGYEFVTVSELIAETIQHKADAPAAAGAGADDGGAMEPIRVQPASIPLSESAPK